MENTSNKSDSGLEQTLKFETRSFFYKRSERLKYDYALCHGDVYSNDVGNFSPAFSSTRLLTFTSFLFSRQHSRRLEWNNITTEISFNF